MKQYPVRLTRYLYFLDEAIYTLQDRLVHKNGDGFKEIIWWCGEIYYSGFYDELWDFIFSFYYNFKCIIYPKYEKLLCRFYEYFQIKPDIHFFILALKLLYRGKCDFNVFTKWNEDTSSIIFFAGRLPKWLKQLDVKKSERNIARSIHKKNYKNILYYIKNGEINSLYELVTSYFTIIHGINLSEKIINTVPYSNKRHILFALVCYLYQPIETIEKEEINIEIDKDEYNDDINKDNEQVIPAYKTLGTRLRYPISDNIGCFPLKRYTCNYKEIYRHHWEYYAYDTPLWKKRFDKYNIITDQTNKKICFNNDLEYEEFCEKYYFESDEQSRKIQEFSIKNIPKITLKKWCDNNILINKLKTIKTENIIISHNDL
jgi:hypothetical protein